AFRVFAGAATELVFRVQPSTATAGARITPQVEVIARDALGNTATGFRGDVTVAIGNNPGGGSLSGTKTAAAVAGVAAFPDLSIPQSGSAYSLSATATGLAGATSSFFTINAGAPTHVTFTPQRIPGDPTAPWPTAGATIAPPVPVVARDALG